MHGLVIDIFFSCANVVPHFCKTIHIDPLEVCLLLRCCAILEHLAKSFVDPFQARISRLGHDTLSPVPRHFCNCIRHFCKYIRLVVIVCRKTRKKRRKQEKGNLIIAPLPNSGQESQSWFTVEKRRRACCIGLAVQAGVHNPHGSGHKSDNCRLQNAGMAFKREKQQHTA